MNIKKIIQILRTAMLSSVTKKSLSESCLVLFEGVCDAVEALEELDKPNIAASPQRTWVGLTDEEIERLHTAWVLGGGFRQLCNAIEATLKDKNT
jgi:hypothetical protein